MKEGMMAAVLTAMFWGAAWSGVILGTALIVSVWRIEWEQARRHPDVWELVRREKHVRP